MSKRFILITHSESGDDYTYFIINPTTPTDEEIDAFLLKNGHDIEDGMCYESYEEIIEIDQDNFIPLV